MRTFTDHNSNILYLQGRRDAFNGKIPRTDETDLNSPYHQGYLDCCVDFAETDKKAIAARMTK